MSRQFLVENYLDWANKPTLTTHSSDDQSQLLFILFILWSLGRNQKCFFYFFRQFIEIIFIYLCITSYILGGRRR